MHLCFVHKESETTLLSFAHQIIYCCANLERKKIKLYIFYHLNCVLVTLRDNSMVFVDSTVVVIKLQLYCGM